jgi:hypothetical protein
MATVPSSPQSGHEGADSNSSWRTTFDGWVKDPKIRHDGLIALRMVLATVVLVLVCVVLLAWIVFAGGGATVGHWVTSVLSTRIGQIAAGSTVAGLGIGGTAVHRLRKRRKARTQPPPP